jgi:hypothetical protein
MSLRRLASLVSCLLVSVFALAAVQAGAAGPTRVLKLSLANVHFKWTGEYWNAHTNPPTPPPIGEQVHFTGVVYNGAAQFGKAAKARVGRIVIDCTVVAIPTDGLCTGIVHVPDGFFTIAGNAPFTKPNVRHYAITGGIGPYVSARGELTTTRAGSATVALYS